MYSPGEPTNLPKFLKEPARKNEVCCMSCDNLQNSNTVFSYWKSGFVLKLIKVTTMFNVSCAAAITQHNQWAVSVWQVNKHYTSPWIPTAHLKAELTAEQISAMPVEITKYRISCMGELNWRAHSNAQQPFASKKTTLPFQTRSLSRCQHHD